MQLEASAVERERVPLTPVVVCATDFVQVPRAMSSAQPLPRTAWSAAATGLVMKDPQAQAVASAMQGTMDRCATSRALLAALQQQQRCRAMATGNVLSLKVSVAATPTRLEDSGLVMQRARRVRHCMAERPARVFAQHLFPVLSAAAMALAAATGTVGRRANVFRILWMVLGQVRRATIANLATTDQAASGSAQEEAAHRVPCKASVTTE